MELAIRISTHQLTEPTTWSSEEFVKEMELHNEEPKVKSFITITRSYFVTETEDKDGKQVKPHQHGFIRFEGVSLPTFRKIFKKRILKIELYATQVRGNSLYSIQKNQGQLCYLFIIYE